MKKSGTAKHAVLLLLIALASLGSKCSSTPPACGAPVCAANEVRACLNKCVVPVPVGGGCSDDPCAPNGICADTAVCVNGTCQNPGQGIAAQCDPDQPHQCSGSRYCHRKECVPGVGYSMCAYSGTQGSTCDSDFATFDSKTQCAPCEPGLKCVSGHCHEPCTAAEDCPCNASFVCSSSLCFQCNGVGQSCDAQTKCCGGASCSGGKCCQPAGASCAGGADCCGTDVCLGSVCKACTTAGTACTSNAQCCSGTSCQNGVCASTCTPTAEVCDGKDNDCDGKVDDGVVFNPSACNVVPTNCSNSFQGTWKCVNGAKICDPGQVCSGCGDQPSTVMCGQCGVVPCVVGQPCTPGYVCKSSPPAACNISNPPSGTHCFPIDANHCNGCGPGKCWTPADVLSGTCPP